MLIIINTLPFENENPLGALYIALSCAEAGIPTHVVFVEEGLYCLVHPLEEALSTEEFFYPIISDLVRTLYGTVKFYYIPSSCIDLDTSHIIKGVKKISYSDLLVLIRKYGKNLLYL